MPDRPPRDRKYPDGDPELTHANLLVQGGQGREAPEIVKAAVMAAWCVVFAALVWFLSARGG